MTYRDIPSTRRTIECLTDLYPEIGADFNKPGGGSLRTIEQLKDLHKKYPPAESQSSAEYFESFFAAWEGLQALRHIVGTNRKLRAPVINQLWEIYGGKTMLGVKSELMACVILDIAGWQYELPSPILDVIYKVDLIPVCDSKKYLLQVKSSQNKTQMADEHHIHKLLEEYFQLERGTLMQFIDENLATVELQTPRDKKNLALALWRRQFLPQELRNCPYAVLYVDNNELCWDEHWTVAKKRLGAYNHAPGIMKSLYKV